MSAFSKIFPRSGLLLLSRNAISSLVPSTLIAQAEALLNAHRLEDLVALADRQRKKLESRVEIDQDEQDELCYIFLLIGFQQLRETLFEDAGNNLFNGHLDPRILISYYPNLRGNLFLDTDQADLFAGVQERMPSEASVEDIIIHNLVANYSPHLKPDTKSAPPTAELKKILLEAAHHMLEVYLRRWKARDEVSPSHNSAQIRTVVDTVYLKLLANGEKTGELYSMIQAEEESKAHYIMFKEVESTLITTGQYNALTMLYRQRGADDRCLELWSKLVEGTYTDPDLPVQTALAGILSLLSASKDRALVNRYALWLLGRGFTNEGFQLLTVLPSTQQAKRGRTKSRPKTTTEQQRQEEQEDLKLLEEIEETAGITPEAKSAYLEWLTLGRRKSSSEFHTRFIRALLDQLFSSFQDENVLKLWRAKNSSFASSTSTTSFPIYLSQSTPDSPHKRIRLKTLLFLQGSDLYDLNEVYHRLQDVNEKLSSVLVIERAVVQGKLGHHRETLSLLVRSLHDSVSAEAYCTLGGRAVIPPKTAMSVTVQSLAHHTEGPAESLFTFEAVDEKLRKELIRTLLEVYMSDEGAGPSSGKTKPSNLMNSQAVNLDVLDIVSISFLSRSLRRNVHASYEGKIVKAITAGQNLQVKDDAWDVLRDAGYFIEEAEEGAENGGASDDLDEPEEVFDEKQGLGVELVPPVFDEKSVLNGAPWSDEPGVDEVGI
ncbi:hypothetical protein DL96DRAFT_1583497 [Flagelloscypha sp. PMI_526]|nr:hypothetical protein DL96DRAFT_1583497 [Flagelloscypha sp. PMI_526]